MKAVILAGGDLRSGLQLPALEEAALVIAADSGLRHARPLGLEPHAVVGDFDSVSAQVLDSYPDLPRFEHPQDKDLLDLELAIELAMQRGATELVVLGAFGSRLDQSLAALLVGARLCRAGIPTSLHDGMRDAYLVTAGGELAPALPDGTLFSLLALEDARCSVSGADYELEREPLPFGVGLGLANRARGGPHVQVHAGLVALIVEWAA